MGLGCFNSYSTLCSEIFGVTPWRILKNLKSLPLKVKEAKYAPLEKLGQNVLLTPTPVPMPTWLLLNIVRTLITLKAVKGRKNNGQAKGLGR